MCAAASFAQSDLVQTGKSAGDISIEMIVLTSAEVCAVLVDVQPVAINLRLQVERLWRAPFFSQSNGIVMKTELARCPRRSEPQYHIVYNVFGSVQ